MQQEAFKIMLEKLAKHEPLFLGEIMRQAGYSEATAINPGLNLTSKIGWKELLATIDDSPLLMKLLEIALGDDKRAAMDAIKTILIDLKGLGAEKSGKVIGLFEKVGELQIDDKPTDIPTENQLPASPGSTESLGV